MASKTKKSSLSEKINSLVTAAPTLFGSDDENEETKAKVVERYDESDSDVDAAASTFRKRNVDLLDQVDNRYKGKKVSRKDVYSEESGSEESYVEDQNDSDNDDEVESNDENSLSDSNGSVGEEAIESNEEHDSDGPQDSDNEESMNGEQSDSEGDSEVDQENPLRRERGRDSNFKSMTDTNVRAEVEKGNCVREQLKVWENLLEVRIKLQKCLITSNKMPQNDAYKDLKSNEQFTKECNDSKNKLTGLLENLLDIQKSLLGNYPETKKLRNRGTKRKANEKDNSESEDPMDEEICSDTEDEMEKSRKDENLSEESSSETEENDQPEKKKTKRSLEEYEKILAENHNIYKGYRDSVIEKWNDKTRIAAGKTNKGSNQPVVKQIEFIMKDKTKLIKRTQLKRSEYDIIGKSVVEDEDGRRNQEYDSEIYDDDDFYHQLLRELIEYKSADITDPIQLSKQWIQLQNMRNKMKRKIDTRATKGRRVRYNVHTKLVNYMAPICVNDTWSDAAKTELYNSLFGKIKTIENSDKRIDEVSEK